MQSPAARGPAQKAKLGYFEPTEEETLAAVESLYADELKPFGRVLLKRVRELSTARLGVGSLEESPLVDPVRLRAICAGCRALFVWPEEGREFSVTLLGREPTFVDAGDTMDPYPEDLWVAFADFFATAGEDESRLPGGRYACAKALAGRNLPFLAGRSLGELCHVVQLAISSRKILGHLDGNTVPYMLSEEWAKIQCAMSHQPERSAKKAPIGMPVASWEQAIGGLVQILNEATGPEPGSVTLSNVKRLFNSRFKLQLSETVLGYSRLIDLLRDERFSAICSISTQESGQIVVKRVDGGAWSQPGLLLNEDMHLLEDACTLPCAFMGACAFPHLTYTSCEDAACLSTTPPMAWDPLAMDHQHLCGLSSALAYGVGQYMWDYSADQCLVHANSFSESTEDGSMGSSKSEADEWESSGPSSPSEPPSPSVLVVGRVNNTFLDFNCELLASGGGASRRRTNSVPKSMGSAKLRGHDGCPVVVLTLPVEEEP